MNGQWSDLPITHVTNACFTIQSSKKSQPACQPSPPSHGIYVGRLGDLCLFIQTLSCSSLLPCTGFDISWARKLDSKLSFPLFSIPSRVLGDALFFF